MRFEQDDIIVHDDKNYQCIICDDNVAIFGEWCIRIDEDGEAHENLNYEGMFAVDNREDVDDNFEYTIIDDLLDK